MTVQPRLRLRLPSAAAYSGSQEQSAKLHAAGPAARPAKLPLCASCCGLLALLMALAGCSSGPTGKNALLRSHKHVESSAAELSARNQSLLGLYSAEIESAADKIIQESPSPTVRRQALVWKVEAIPVLQTTMLNIDPLAAAIDTWGFLLQMSAFMDQPAQRQAFGESHPVVVETLKRMENQMEQLVQTAAPSADLEAARQRIAAWAKANPIEMGLAGRNTPSADLIRRTEQSDLGAVASVRAIAESIGDLTARMDSYNAYLPKQARWQAELLLLDLERDPRIDAAMSSLSTLSTSVEKTAGAAEHMPELMGQLRATVLSDVEGQRLAAQAFLREERVAAFEALNQERIATMADIRAERQAATVDLRQERQIVLDALHNEKDQVVSDLRSAGDKAVQDFDARSRSLIDHFFMRALELMVLAMAVSALAAWLLLRRLAPSRPSRGERFYDRAA